MPAQIGANLTFTVANTTDGKSFGLGDRVTDQNGNEYVYVKASGAITKYDGVVFDSAYNAASITTTNAPTGSFGIAPVAFASGDYGFVQVNGTATLNVLASCAKDIILWTTSTAGSLDDATSSNYAVLGISLITANGGSASNGVVNMQWPTILKRAGTA